MDIDILTEVSQSVRKYTRKRMHFVAFLVMTKPDTTNNTLSIAYEVPDAENETVSAADLSKLGYSPAKFRKKPASQMLCEGEVSRLHINDEQKTCLPVAYFNKQACRRIITVELKRKQLLPFAITDGSNNMMCEGEIYT